MRTTAPVPAVTPASSRVAPAALVALVAALAGCKAGAATEAGSANTTHPVESAGDPATTPGAGAHTSAAGQAPIVVELFTSQGCSSCPPADALLSRLGAGEVAGDAPVIALAFHVDYWNGLGWADPFSSPRWTARQQAYAGRIARGRVYTPQLVIHGMADEIGSRRDAIARAIAAAAGEAPPQVPLTLEVADRDGGALRVHVRGTVSGERTVTGLVAVYENGVVTAVSRGENAGRQLANDHIVRRLVPFTVPDEPSLDMTVTVELDRAWRRDHLGVAVLLQDPDTLRIHGAAQVPPRAR